MRHRTTATKVNAPAKIGIGHYYTDTTAELGAARTPATSADDLVNSNAR